MRNLSRTLQLPHRPSLRQIDFGWSDCAIFTYSFVPVKDLRARSWFAWVASEEVLATAGVQGSEAFGVDAVGPDVHVYDYEAMYRYFEEL
jgi:hypothetical protein